MSLREKVAKLANENPDGIRKYLIPILKKASMSKEAGYTHYWYPQRPFTDQEWSKLIQVAKNIIAKAEKTYKVNATAGDYYDEEIAEDGIQIRGPIGTGRPILDNESISLNGDASKDLDHETFMLDKVPQDDFEFCKTARKPYDSVVVSILAAAKRIAPGALKVKSDGGGSAIKKVLAKKSGLRRN